MQNYIKFIITILYSHININPITEMRTTNHFEPSQNLSNMEDNQFLLAPSRFAYSTGKDETIRKLEEKNQRLMTEIQKIEKVLQDPAERTVYGNRLPQISGKATEQQLQNAYKQIRTYEYQINKLRATSKEGTYVEQVKKCEFLLKQKEEMSDRLRKQLNEVKRQTVELAKQLANDNKKQQLETKNVKLNNEIKWLREKLMQMESRTSMNRENLQKQMNFIKKLQTRLLQQGLPSDTLRVLREKHNPSTTNQNQSFYSSRRNIVKTTQYNRSHVQQSEKQEIIQDRTPQAYSALSNEIKLLRKMEKDYQNQASLLQKEKQEASNVNLKTRNKLLEVEDQIEKVQSRIEQLKKMIDPAKLKPTRGLSMPNAHRYGDANVSFSKSAFQHLFRNQEVGKLSKEGRRFSDRIKLAKNESKIVAVDFYESRQGKGNLIGIQATYEVKGVLKKGSINMIVDQKHSVKKSIILFDNQDYLKNIECICNEKGIIVGIAVYSNKGISGKGGSLQGTRRPLSIAPNQYPSCFYGSFAEAGLELFGSEVIQEKPN